MNQVILTGNLVRDPDLSQTASGVNVCRFDIAVNRAYKASNGERQTDFFHVTAWRELAESVAKYCRKGNRVLVRGSIETRTYEANDGTKRSTVDVIADKVEFLFRNTQAAEGENSESESFDDPGQIPF